MNCELRGTSVKWYILSLFFESHLCFAAISQQDSVTPCSFKYIQYISSNDPHHLIHIDFNVCVGESVNVLLWVGECDYLFFPCLNAHAYLRICSCVWMSGSSTCLCVPVCVSAYACVLPTHWYLYPSSDIYSTVCLPTRVQAGSRETENWVIFWEFCPSERALWLRQQQLFLISCWSCSHLSGENVSIQSCIASESRIGPPGLLQHILLHTPVRQEARSFPLHKEKCTLNHSVTLCRIVPVVFLSGMRRGFTCSARSINLSSKHVLFVLSHFSSAAFIESFCAESCNMNGIFFTGTREPMQCRDTMKCVTNLSQ